MLISCIAIAFVGLTLFWFLPLNSCPLNCFELNFPGTIHLTTITFWLTAER